MGGTSIFRLWIFFIVISGEETKFEQWNGKASFLNGDDDQLEGLYKVYKKLK